MVSYFHTSSKHSHNQHHDTQQSQNWESVFLMYSTPTKKSTSLYSHANITFQVDEILFFLPILFLSSSLLIERLISGLKGQEWAKQNQMHMLYFRAQSHFSFLAKFYSHILYSRLIRSHFFRVINLKNLD